MTTFLRSRRTGKLLSSSYFLQLHFVRGNYVVKIALTLTLLSYIANGQQLVGPVGPFTVTEGIPFEVCFTIDNVPQTSNFVVNVKDNPMKDDNFFKGLDVNFTFSAGSVELMKCRNDFLIELDDIISPLEITSPVFQVTTISNGIPSSPMIVGPIVLTDSTVLNIGFEQPSYIFMENMTTEQICITVDGEIRGAPSFIVELAYVDETTDAGDDYIAGSSQIMFNSNTNNRMVCLELDINADDLFEGAEMLTVELISAERALSGLAIDPTRNSTVVTILDLDANCGPPPMRDSLTVSPSNPPYGVFPSLELVANPGAVAAYSCVDQDLVVMGSSELTCRAVNDTNAEWDPPDAPTCTTVAPSVVVSTTDDNSTTSGVASSLSVFRIIPVALCLVHTAISSLLH